MKHCPQCEDIKKVGKIELYRSLRWWWWSGIVVPHVCIPIGEVLHHGVHFLLLVLLVGELLLLPRRLPLMKSRPMLVLKGLIRGELSIQSLEVRFKVLKTRVKPLHTLIAQSSIIRGHRTTLARFKISFIFSVSGGRRESGRRAPP